LLKFLPKPGAWMEKFKIAMGFPMLATPCGCSTSPPAATANGFVARRFFSYSLRSSVDFRRVRSAQSCPQRHCARHRFDFAGWRYAFALENQLNWRATITAPDATDCSKNLPGGIDWQRWSPDACGQSA